MNVEKAEEILDNYINGNISDFKEQIRGLTKADLIFFVLYVSETGYADYESILHTIKKYLE